MINIIPLLCAGCHQPIWDPYLLCIDHNTWHEQCVTCSICHCLLHDKCLVRNEKLYCRNDYIKQFGIRCKGCNQLIQSEDSVLRLYTYKSVKSTSIQNDFIEKQNILEFQSSVVTSTNAAKINTSTTNRYELNLANEETDTTKDSFNLSVLIHYFHVDCFKCCDCNRLLTPGEEYTIKNCMPLCIMDYEKYLLDKESQHICTRLQESFRQSLQFEKCTQDVNDNYPTNTNNEDNRMNEQQERYSNEESNDTDVNCKESNRLMTLEIKSDIGNYDKSTSSTIDTSLLNDSVLLSDINISAPNSSDDSSKDADRMDDDELYEMDSDSESGKNSKRPRTILTANQRRRFKAVFEFNPKPTRKIREALATETGLNIRVVQVWFQNQRAKIKKLARRHAQESRQQSNRRMLINNPMINNEPMIRIQSPNSMLFNLRNPTISDIPYLYKTVDNCQDITSVHNEPINENDPDESLKTRMISLVTSCSPPFIHIPQANQMENPYPPNIPYISTASKAMEKSSLTFSTHELFPCLNSVCTNSKSSSLLSEVAFTPITSSSLVISNNNSNNNDSIPNNNNNNGVENNSGTNGSSTFDTSINKLYSMHQTYFM
uniref:Lim homeobox protein n=1 Tax=Schistosoma mansoni TaxID=6183 RepID=A0A5K4F9S6_SCHMA